MDEMIPMFLVMILVWFGVSCILGPIIGEAIYRFTKEETPPE